MGIVILHQSQAHEKLLAFHSLLKRERLASADIKDRESCSWVLSQNHRACERPGCVRRAQLLYRLQERQDLSYTRMVPCRYLRVSRKMSVTSLPRGCFFVRILTPYSLPSKQDENTSESFYRRRRIFSDC